MANKKISELTPKGSALSATDLLEVSVDAGGGTYTTASLTGQEVKDFAGAGKQDTLVSGTNIKTVNGNSILGSGNLVVGGSANPSVISASYSDGTTVTGTLLETLSQSLLIPANTFTSGMLEVICRMTKTGAAGSSTIKVYKNTSNTLVGATLLATVNPGSNIISQMIRTFRINSNTLTGYSASVSNTSDNNSTSITLSTTFTTNVDNYILFTIQLTSLTESANISMARLTQYK